MRINLGALNPASPLAARIRAALERERPLGRALRSAPDAVAPDMTEEAIQRHVVAMVAARARPNALVWHPANGGRRSKAEAGRFKALGVVAGIPDLVAIAEGRVFGLELKTASGRLSDAQREMAARWRAAGGEYAVARSVAEASRILSEWGIIEDHAT